MRTETADGLKQFVPQERPEQFVHSSRWVLQVCSLSPDGLNHRTFIKVEQLCDEFVRVLRLQTKLSQNVVGEVSEVPSDNDLGMANHRRCNNMAVACVDPS